MSDLIHETRALTKDFKGFTAVSQVDLKVVRGSIHALIGPNGAGKTTCFNLLTKFLEPTSGTILFNGQDITREQPAQIARRGIIRSFQISAVFPHLTLLENVRLGLQRKLGVSYHFWKSGKSLHTLDDRARELLAEVGLADMANEQTVNLPYPESVCRLLNSNGACHVATAHRQRDKPFATDQMARRLLMSASSNFSMAIFFNMNF